MVFQDHASSKLNWEDFFSTLDPFRAVNTAAYLIPPVRYTVTFLGKFLYQYEAL